MTTPKISIIVPSYNKAKYINKTIESIISQKYSNIEIIIQDGGSIDNTSRIVNKYAKKYSFIQFESRRDGGQTDAINKGIKKATGEIVTFINADDIYFSGALKEVVKMYKNYPDAQWFVGKGVTIDQNGQKVASAIDDYKNWLLSKNNPNYLLMVNYLFQPSVFFTKKAYRKYGPFVGIGRNVMEYDFWMKLRSDSMPIVTNKYLSGFRLVSSAFSLNNYKNILKADDQIAQKYTNNLFLLTLHWLHNIARTVIALIMNG